MEYIFLYGIFLLVQQDVLVKHWCLKVTLHAEFDKRKLIHVVSFNAQVSWINGSGGGRVV